MLNINVEFNDSNEGDKTNQRINPYLTPHWTKQINVYHLGISFFIENFIAIFVAHRCICASICASNKRKLAKTGKYSRMMYLHRVHNTITHIYTLHECLCVLKLMMPRSVLNSLKHFFSFLRYYSSSPNLYSKIRAYSDNLNVNIQ